MPPLREEAAAFLCGSARVRRKLPVLQTLFTVDEDGAHVERFIVKHGDIGDIAGLDAAELVFKTVFKSLVVRGGLDKDIEGHPGDFPNVLECHVHPEDGTGQRTVGGQTCRTVLHNHIQSAEAGRTIGHMAGAHGVGNQQDALDVFGLKREFNHLGAEVNLIANHFGTEIIQEQSGTHKPDIAVMERGLLIAEMGEVTASGGVDGLELLVGALGVPGGGDDTHFKYIDYS